MKLSDEIERLHALHSGGGLTDAEYTAAKHSLLSPPVEASPVHATTAEPAPTARRRFTLHLGLVLIISLIATAFITNPETESLKRAVDQRMNEESQKKNGGSADGVLTRLAGWAVASTATYDRESYAVFSVGTVTMGVPVVGPTVRTKYIGAFGRWWVSFPISTDRKGS